MPNVRVFNYIEELDAFVITEEYKRLADELELTEWHEAVWIGRLFYTDNDVGEHWFDNWDEREAAEAKAKELGFDESELMIVVPERFFDGSVEDGLCFSPEIRKAFWTDVLKSLELSYNLLFDVARYEAKRFESEEPTEKLKELEARIDEIKQRSGISAN
jgi:hypothetical protein